MSGLAVYEDVLEGAIAQLIDGHDQNNVARRLGISDTTLRKDIQKHCAAHTDRYPSGVPSQITRRGPAAKPIDCADAMRRLRANETQAKVAKMYGVHQSTLRNRLRMYCKENPLECPEGVPAWLRGYIAR